MKKTWNVFSIIALVLTIVGALNWLLIGIFGFNLVNWITMGLAWLETTLYILVGIAGLYMLIWLCMNNFTVNDNANNNRPRTSYNS